MKYLILICVFFSTIVVKAQEILNLNNNTIIPAYNLDISWHKTTLLIFPAPIKSADRGDSYVLAEKVNEANNILKVKAGQKGFEQSNLQVVTSDGKIYSFTINYNENAASLPIDMGKQPPYAPITFRGISLNSKELESCGAKAAGSVPFLKGGRFQKHGMTFSLDGIYIKNDVLFFQLLLKNDTQIPYDASSLRFYVRDKKTVKRTAVQDKEVIPVYVQHTGSPESGKGEVIVVAFPKFTIAEKKFVTAELMEQGGDRNPIIRLDQKKLLKARQL
ncbi:conjugative transposon protein TraN [Pedobacter borealis]|uniref:conjugative transposon protein TraN n=1 Tax=Pedobacter borealis TaxID=475254 RepID=UPI0004930D00|nr:conjugative transposon protein TraN [Pedobacter borealis]